MDIPHALRNVWQEEEKQELGVSIRAIRNLDRKHLRLSSCRTLVA
jgi:hypothetical protein